MERKYRDAQTSFKEETTLDARQSKSGSRKASNLKQEFISQSRRINAATKSYLPIVWMSIAEITELAAGFVEFTQNSEHQDKLDSADKTSGHCLRHTSKTEHINYLQNQPVGPFLVWSSSSFLPYNRIPPNRNSLRDRKRGASICSRLNSRGTTPVGWLSASMLAGTSRPYNLALTSARLDLTA